MLSLIIVIIVAVLSLLVGQKEEILYVCICWMESVGGNQSELVGQDSAL